MGPPQTAPLGAVAHNSTCIFTGSNGELYRDPLPFSTMPNCTTPAAAVASLLDPAQPATLIPHDSRHTAAAWWPRTVVGGMSVAGCPGSNRLATAAAGVVQLGMVLKGSGPW